VVLRADQRTAGRIVDGWCYYNTELAVSFKDTYIRRREDGKLLIAKGLP
jgi:hypothetical protein